MRATVCLSAVLCNLLGLLSTHVAAAVSGASTANQRRHVHFDLSGRVNCLLRSNLVSEHSKPLFKSNPIAPKAIQEFLQKRGLGDSLFDPSINFLVDYDFSQSLYGATRIISEFRWSSASAQSKPSKPRLSPLLGGGGGARSFLSRIGAPQEVQVSAEKGILKESDDTAGVVKLSWRTHPRNFLTTALRVDTNKALTFSASIPIHDRLTWHGRLFGQLRPTSIMKFPLPPTSNDNLWLVPDFSVNTVGDLTSLNQLWLPWTNGKRAADQNGGRFGVRFTVRRRCAFDFLRSLTLASTSDEEAFTWFGLELQGVNSKHRIRTKLEAALEDIRETAQLSVFQDLIV